MKIEYKILIAIILMLGGLYASAMCFNEVNPWIGILLCVLSLGLGIKYLVKLIKNQK